VPIRDERKIDMQARIIALGEAGDAVARDYYDHGAQPEMSLSLLK
jgi:hypothetical protein